MTEILKDRNCRIIVVIGMYLLFEAVNKIIDSDYNLKATYDDKCFILQKQPISSSIIDDTTI